MNDKDSAAFREAYGQRLAAHLCQQYFSAHPTTPLDGPAVLRFTPIRQVNLLVVQQLMGQWQQEMARLRSPYFDFEADDVRQALTQFMNVLSRRIRLARPAFEPLLARAVTDALAIPLDAAGTFARQLLGGQPAATVAQLRDALRYIDSDKPFYQAFLDTLPPDPAPLPADTLLVRLRAFEAAGTVARQPLPDVVAAFDALLPLREADLRPAPAVPAAAPAPVSAVPPAPEKVVPPPPTELPAPAPSPTPPAPAATPPTPAPASAAPVAAPPRPRPDAAPAGVPLYEKLKAGQPAAPSLSETLRPERAAATLAEQAPRVESLREAISINQRYSFINELFGGENLAYHAAIQHLDTLPDAAAARHYVTQELAGRHDWSRKDEHVNKLLKLIDRKFA